MALKRPIWVAGCMSGTSLDGVDVAAILTDGVRVLEFGPTAYRPYADGERAILQAALGCWHSDAPVAKAAKVVEAAHLEVLRDFDKVDLIGFHGQTLAHDPRGKGTHQAGSGAVLAQALKTPVAWDFRSNDVAMGGQGAPLAPIYHGALAEGRFVTPIAFLNLGGVGNITYVDPTLPAEDGLLAFDTGPANAPLDDLIQSCLGQGYDKDGALALAGSADGAFLRDFLAHPYFQQPVPKSLDRDQFKEALSGLENLPLDDAAATVVALIAASVAKAVEALPQMPAKLIVCGGGRKNPAIMRAMGERIDTDVETAEDHGWNGDMIEAQCFAYLAARVKAGMPTSFPQTTGVAAPIGGGMISKP